MAFLPPSWADKESGPPASRQVQGQPRHEKGRCRHTGEREGRAWREAAGCSPGGPALPGHLVEHTARAPQVHLEAVEAIGEEALRGPVPAGGDVLGVRLPRVDAPARAEVPEF